MADKGCFPVATAGDDQPFLLLAGCTPAVLGANRLEPALRRMGLQPEASLSCAEAALFEGAVQTIRFGDHSAHVGRAAAGVVQASASAMAGPEPDDILACVPVSAADGDRVAYSRELFKIAVLLIDATGADQLYWSPAGLWSDARQFRAAVAEMLISGMPPVLHLIAFRPDPASAALRSHGLAYFAGQELEVRDGGNLAQKDVVRRLARLAIDIMINGAIRAPRDFPGLTSDERVRVEPSESDQAATLFVSVVAR